MNKKQILTTITIIVTIISLITMAVNYLVYSVDVILPAVITLAYVVLILVIYSSIGQLKDDISKQIQTNLDSSYDEALIDGKIGVLVYNDEYEITWMSKFFEERHISHLGEKLLSWLPELQDVIKGDSDKTNIVINDDKYSVYKEKSSYTLMFKDITIEYDLGKKLANQQYVLGLLSYDNLDETSISEDDISYINTNIKVPVMEYFKKMGVVYKTLRTSKMLLILNEEKLKTISNDHYSILNLVRNESKKADLDITISLAFARGSDNLTELDEEAQSLIELAQSRGGDQVAIRKIGEDVTLFGGSSEAKEKQNKVKVRVIFNTIKDLISKSSKVIIVGHNEMDADCVGAALCMSNVVLAQAKQSYIVIKDVAIEPMIGDVLRKYNNVLTKKHSYVSQSQAIDMLDEDTLVILVDHHSLDQSAAPELIKRASKSIVIDHHRRKVDLQFDPMMIYVEASASSAGELTGEFLPYLPKKYTLLQEEANIMYLGILIDTDRFRIRTGVRTFDVAKLLRKYGADPVTCDILCEEPYDMVLKRSAIINQAKIVNGNILISSLNEGKFPRSIASQACDVMVKTKEADAAFVICNNTNEDTIITARSNGKINVQIIMEKMHGGGHMSAAGLQRKDTTVGKLENELLLVLDEYLKGETK